MRLTTSGIVFLIAGAALCIAAYRFALPGLLPAGVLLIALVLLSLLIALFTGVRMTAELSTSRRSIDGLPLTGIGERTTIRARIRNRSPLPIGRIELNLQPAPGFGEPASAQIPGIPAGGEITVDADFSSTQRGVSGLGAIRAAIDGPFGLSAVTSTVHRAYPVAVAARIHPLRPSHTAGPTAHHAEDPRVVRGTSSRDFHTREYVPGDDLRHIHWPSTAKVGDFMVRQEIDEQMPQVAVILDSAEVDPGDPAAELIVSAAASFALAHLRSGHDVVIFASGRRHQLSGRSGEDAVRLLSAEYSVGDPTLPDDPARGALLEAIICTVTHSRADLISARLPRRLPRRRLVAEDVPEAAQLGASLFQETAALPSAWTRTGRRVR